MTQSQKPIARVLALMVASGLYTLMLVVPKAEAQNSNSNNFSTEKEYQNCLKIVAQNANAGFEHALAWEDQGGGHAAQHCIAVALNSLGHFAEAADRLEKMAVSMPDKTPPAIVAEILAHSALSWQQADNTSRAYDIQSKALRLSPNNPDILVDRATTLFARNDYWEAIDDLNAALDARPEDPSILIYRASAYRHVDAWELGLFDVNRALRLVPDHPEGLLERGILRRLSGNLDGARQDWLTLINLHDGRPAADIARRNLELLDVNPDG